MATITVKDIPDELYAALKKKAAVHRRSVNREVIYYIEEALSRREINVEELLGEARRIQDQIGDVPYSEGLLYKYRNTGRR
jgi:plasmid stability protein